MKARIYVTLKEEIHDPQGKAVLQALSVLGFNEVKQVRMGKYFEMELTATSPETGGSAVDKMCETLLANTVIEKYRYEINE